MTETVIAAYKFALDPTVMQEQMLRSHCGAQRRAFNWGLGLVKANLDQRAAEASYGIAEDERTPSVNWSAYALRKGWNGVKQEVAPWWRENSKEAYASGLANLATGLGNWSKSRNGTRKGPRVRFPRFKSKKAPRSCTFTTGAFGLADGDRRHVKLPRIGSVRTCESTRKLARHLERGTARIRSATVTFSRGRWFVSFSVDLTRTDQAPTHPTAVVGVDVGITHLAVLSQPIPGITDADGMVGNPQHLEHAQQKLRRLQRQMSRRRGPDKRTGQQPSKRWLDTQRRVTKLHARVANSRADGLHKLTTGLTAVCGTVVVEDLNVAGMLGNRKLARRIAGAAWGELRRQLTYKTNWRGSQLVVADRWYPSSKKCSNPCCGVVKTKLRLNERVFRCDHCDLVLHRDTNAARNLAALADRVTGDASSPSCGATINEPTGNPGKTSPPLAPGTATGRPPRSTSHSDIRLPMTCNPNTPIGNG